MERSEIRKIRSLSIEGYLKSIGIEPVKICGLKLYYFSPFRSETTPSFVVNSESNTFKDFADSEKPEDIIRLVQRLYNLSFHQACEYLKNRTDSAPPKPFLSIGSTSSVYENGIYVEQVKPLESHFLWDYLKKRKISPALSNLYLKEIIYTAKERRFKGIGFMNHSGGYEIRSATGIKLSTRPKDITYFPVSHSKTVSVFEGFFDFLSALMYFNVTASRHSVLVLNSTGNLVKAVPFLSRYERITAYLDRDTAGKKGLEYLIDYGLPVTDGSMLYHGFKDFNEFWQNCKTGNIIN